MAHRRASLWSSSSSPEAPDGSELQADHLRRRRSSSAARCWCRHLGSARARSPCGAVGSSAATKPAALSDCSRWLQLRPLTAFCATRCAVPVLAAAALAHWLRLLRCHIDSSRRELNGAKRRNTASLVEGRMAGRELAGRRQLGTAGSRPSHPSSATFRPSKAWRPAARRRYGLCLEPSASTRVTGWAIPSVVC